MAPLDNELEHLIATPSDNSEHLRVVHDLVVEVNAQRVVELGVGHGRTTTALMCGLYKTGGRLWSCDIQDYPGTRAKFDPNRWAFVVADSLEWGKVWTGPIDLLLIDSSHGRAETEAELRLYTPFLREGGVIVMHDTIAHPAVLDAIHAWRLPAEWGLELRENNNGLAVIRRLSRRLIRFPFAKPGDLKSTSGPTVLVAALTEAVSQDPRFANLDEGCSDQDILWYPTYQHLYPVLERIREGRRIAIGPNLVFANSQAAGKGAHETEICGYENYAAIFTLSRWYAALTRKRFRQQTRHTLIDYPLPGALAGVPWQAPIAYDALIYVKGGAAEHEIASELSKMFPVTVTAEYGKFTRGDLLKLASQSRACFYISREDNYPLAAVEIGLMGCPIISDERACPVMLHGLTGICVPVRERGEEEPFAWSPGAAGELARAWAGALILDRSWIRATTIHRHSSRLAVERIVQTLYEEKPQQ